MPKSNEENKTRKVKLKRAKLRKVESAVTSQEGTTKKTKKKGRGKKIFKICFFVLLALFVVGVGLVLGVLKSVISETDEIELAQLKNLKLTSTVLDSKGKQIGQMSGGENRLIADYEDLPQDLIDAVVAIEDERFWTHKGVDIRRTGAAVVTYVLNRGNSSFGGSTITQQLIKNVTDDRETSWKRKIREWYRAYSLEQELEKEEILEAYLNKIYFGEGANGIEIAAQTYFGKTVSKLNLAESACLAAAIQTPEGTNPYSGAEYKARLIERQKIVLDKMLELGNITREEYDEALAYKLVFKKGKVATASNSVQSYAVDAVFEQVAKDLAEQKGITYDAAFDMVASNGYVIYSTIDSKVQAAIDKQAKNTKYFYKDKDGDMMQCAAIVLDNKTGNVVGMLGGVGEKKGLDFNRAIDAKLQPGSTFKPIAAYGPAFEQGVSYPGKGIDDVPININGYRPTNWYGYYYGYVTAREAIIQSMNIPAVKTLQLVDLDYAFQFAKNMGITTLTAANKNLSMSLGSSNVRVIDMAAAYATMANGGVYTEPKLYTKVLDSEGNEILVTSRKFKRVMSATTAYMLTDCLRSVVNSGTGYYAKFSNSIQLAAKTGNTNDDKDQWFIGYTPYYTMAVWNGYDDPETIGSRRYIGSYPYTATVVFTNVMKTIHSGLKKASFTKPNGIVNATICTVSGLVATDACRKDTRKVVKSEIFASGKVPTDKCNVHKLVEVCSVSKKLPTDFCHMYEDLKEISVITRSVKAKTSDQKYLMPTARCTLHRTEPAPEEPVIPEENIPGDEIVNPDDTTGNGDSTGENTGTGTDTGTGAETTTPGENTGVGGSIYSFLSLIYRY